MAPTLGYWAMRGLVQPLRDMLHYTGTAFEDKQYTVGPTFSWDAWLADKDNLGLEFPNIPYYIDDDLKITESAAIGGHIARKHGLAGACEKDFIRLDVAAGIMRDLGKEMDMLVYAADFETKKDAYIAALPPKIGKLSKLLGPGNYLLGDKIAYQDFVLFELLERLQNLVPDCLSAHQNLTAFHARIEALPAIAKYRSSPSFQKIKTRFNNRIAKFGAGKY